jgi:hypothetical protein
MLLTDFKVDREEKINFKTPARTAAEASQDMIGHVPTRALTTVQST